MDIYKTLARLDMDCEFGTGELPDGRTQLSFELFLPDDDDAEEMTADIIRCLEKWMDERKWRK